MDKDLFVENFALQFDDTEKEIFTIDTNFKDLDEWSSLVALSIIAMVDEEYNVKISGDNIRNSNSIADLYEIVKNNLT